MRDKFTKEKSSSTWSNSYSSQFIEKYQQQQEEFENERQEFEKMDKDDLKLDELNLAKSFQFGNILGRGVFTVFRSKENSSGKEFAIKVVNKKQASSLGLDPTILTRQIQILKGIAHENIIKLIQEEDSTNLLALVTELAEGEVLVKVAEKKRKFLRGICKENDQAVVGGCEISSLKRYSPSGNCSTKYSYSNWFNQISRFHFVPNRQR